MNAQKKPIPHIITTFMMFLIFLCSIQVTVHFGSRLTVSVLVNAVIGLMSMLGLTILYLVNIMDSFADRTTARLFGTLVAMAYLGAFFDNLSWVLEGIQALRIVNYLMNTCAFLVMPLSLVVFWSYQNHVFIGQTRTGSKLKRAVYLFALLDCVFILAGAATGFLFFVDANGYYIEGNGLIFINIYPLMLFGCCLLDNLERKMPFNERLSLLTFVLVPLVTIVIIHFFPDYSFVYAMYYMDLVLIYGTLEHKRHIEYLKKSAQIAEQNRILQEQQTQIMISQIQPHFLYNTLTAIYQLCDMDTHLAQKMILDFSGYLRSNMDAIRSKKPIPFEKELDHTKTYLEIELLRFADILSVEYQIEATDFTLPALSLQPLVENAVKYGVRSREEGGTVTISTKRAGNTVYITVHDDGMGFDPTRMPEDGRSHTGIENTRQRLRLMADADLVIDSRIGEGTTATIILEEKQNEPVVSG